MTRKTGQILNGLLMTSGLVHISGLVTNWDYDSYAGLFMIIIGGLWLTNDYFKNGKTFLSGDSVTIDMLDFKWWRIKEIIGVAFLFFLLIANDGQLPNSFLVTLILYFSLLVILDHRRNVEISNKFISIDGRAIPLDRVTTFDFKPGQITISTDYPIILQSIGPVTIDLSKFNEESRALLIKKLKRD